MAKFIIEQRDSAPYRGEIIKFWKEYLPGTPAKRFDWMSKGNPAGPARWFLAFEKVSGELAGTLSVMPKKLAVNGKFLMAGIIGDLMVSKKYRVFGPALQLQRTVLESFPSLGVKLLYTVPNKAAEEIMLRAGYQKIGHFIRLVKPLNFKKQFQMNSFPRIGAFLAWDARLVLRLISKETYMKNEGQLREIREFNEAHNVFLRQFAGKPSIAGERTHESLNWRFFKNPLRRLNVLVLEKAKSKNLLGYIAYFIENNIIYIYDITAYERKTFVILLGSFLKFVRQGCYSSVSINILNRNPLIKDIKSFGFFTRDNVVPLLAVGDTELFTREWFFFDADRNI